MLCSSAQRWINVRCLPLLMESCTSCAMLLSLNLDSDHSRYFWQGSQGLCSLSSRVDKRIVGWGDLSEFTETGQALAQKWLFLDLGRSGENGRVRHPLESGSSWWKLSQTYVVQYSSTSSVPPRPRQSYLHVSKRYPYVRLCKLMSKVYLEPQSNIRTVAQSSSKLKLWAGQLES